MQDNLFMKRAIELAKRGVGKVNPNPMVGAVIVKNGKIIGEGYHMEYGKEHAEVNAIKSAKEDVSDSTIYVTLEPCSHYGKQPPCAYKIVESNIKKVVIGSLDPNPLVSGRGIKILKDAGIDVVTGVMEDECLKLNEVFMKYISKKKPFVAMKCAMSLDGKIATKLGESKWISSKESRELVQKLRNKYTGIMVGINTVIKDNPRLTCRLEDGRSPVRIVIDSNLRIPNDSNIVKTANKVKTIVATTKGASKAKISDLKNKNVEVIITENSDSKVNLNELMSKLYEKQIDGILLEGGGTLNYSALEEGIVDKVLFFIAPIIIGGTKSICPVSGDGINKLNEAFKINNLSCSNIGQDILIEGYIK